MSATDPIPVVPLFRELSHHLLTLLGSLSTEEWHLPTVSSQRRVRDIVSHLLDGSLRRLSLQRDGYIPFDGVGQPQAEETLLAFLNRLNGEWETATRRLSPRVLIDWLRVADDELAALFESLDPFGPAIFPVAWAGETCSRNWMDVGREYTEKWHHTQQIFVATRRPSTIIERQLFHPCLDIFMRALPWTFQSIGAPMGSVVTVTITGMAGGNWSIRREDAGWRLIPALPDESTARCIIGQDSAWQLFTRRMARTEALARFPDIRLEGEPGLSGAVIDMVSVMA